MASEDVGKLYPVAKAVLTPLFRAAWKLDVRGLENIPESGGAILCPNHTSVLDSFFVPTVLPRKVTYVGKAEYMDDWKTRKLFPALGMIPIDRTGGDAAERALTTAQRILDRGELFGIYPEGTRSRDGRLYRGKTGPARLALRAGVPIIPVGLRGTRDVMPPDARFPHLRKPVTIIFGKPIDTSRYADRANDHLALRQLIDEVMYEIRELSGQEYVNEYASKRAEPTPSPDLTIDLRADGSHPPEVALPVEAQDAEELVSTAHVDDQVPVNGHGRTGSPRGGGRTGSERRTDRETDFTKSTRPRSSAEVLRNPPRRAHLADK